MNLDEIYFKDNFTKEGEKVNLEINKLEAECITSKNNKFHLDDEGNLKVNSITTIEPIITEIVTDILYPIGSIYMNVNEIDPNLILGGTWERIKDTFLLASGNKYGNKTTGGAESVTLDISQIPAHNHSATPHIGWGSGVYGAGSGKADMNNPGTLWPTDIGYTGGSQPHSNMPPYLTVCVWKRVA